MLPLQAFKLKSDTEIPARPPRDNARNQLLALMSSPGMFLMPASGPLCRQVIAKLKLATDLILEFGS